MKYLVSIEDAGGDPNTFPRRVAMALKLMLRCYGLRAKWAPIDPAEKILNFSGAHAVGTHGQGDLSQNNARPTPPLSSPSDVGTLPASPPAGSIERHRRGFKSIAATGVPTAATTTGPGVMPGPQSKGLL